MLIRLCHTEDLPPLNQSSVKEETLRFVIALLAAAIAVTLGTGGATETWVLDDDPALTWVRTIATEVPVATTTVSVVHVDHTAERACVMVPIHREADGDLYLGPESERVFTGGLEMSDIRASLVGHYLNIAFEQALVDSWDMELSSIDVIELDKVTICE